MHLVVGLGNPGAKYAGTRHNIGFIAVEEILGRYSFAPLSEKFKGQFTTGTVAGHKVAVLMPHTFMNLSGESVQKAAHFYKIPPENIWVIHDEIDMEPFKLKVKKGGGDAGHNGLKNITKLLGTPDYWRVRVGVGRPQTAQEVHSYVLDTFRADEQDGVDATVRVIAKRLPLLLKGEVSAALDMSVN